MRTVAIFAAILMSSSCVTIPRLDGPATAARTANPAGFDRPIRTYALDRTFYEAHAQEATARIAASASDGSIDFLALSGGGAGGAYGAGILVGLSEAHTRPQYEIVTGVSTGALIAPFAFLGSEWDDKLTQAYAGGASDHLMRSLGWRALVGTSAFQGRPLRDLVERFVTDDLIAAVAREAATGRMLLVATTNLDREETVIWNLGAIAEQGGQSAKQLFINVLIASASVPGVFPPVMIRVEDAGQAFEEMHVDGGASTPFFLAPDIMLIMGYRPDAFRGANVFVISNSQLAGPARTTPVNTVSIAARSFSAMLDHMTRTALAQTGSFAQSNDMHFRFTVIPTDYPFAGSLAFDRREMSALFEYGRRCAAQGQVWVSAEQALARAEQTGATAATGRDTLCPLLTQTHH